MEEMNAPPQSSSFELNKLSKGYNWKCKIYTEDLEEAKKKIEDFDNWANINYGGGVDE
jgi:hypothetical protein